jgi:hypothetical protein
MRVKEWRCLGGGVEGNSWDEGGLKVTSGDEGTSWDKGGGVEVTSGMRVGEWR